MHLANENFNFNNLRVTDRSKDSSAVSALLDDYCIFEQKRAYSIITITNEPFEKKFSRLTRCKTELYVGQDQG